MRGGVSGCRQPRRRLERGVAATELIRSPLVARTEHTPAVLLRTIAYGESDRIVTLLTESRGKLALLARGARKSHKRFQGALEPYALIEAEIAVGTGQLGRLAQARLVRAFPGVLADLERMSLAAAALELVREALPEREPDPRFLPFLTRLFELAETLPPGDALRVAFALRLLALIGLAPNLDACGRCGRRAPEGKAALFDPGLGAIVCRACGGGPVKLLGPLRSRMGAAMTRRWDALASSDWPASELDVARDAVDELLAQHVSHRLNGRSLVAQVREVRNAYRSVPK